MKKILTLFSLIALLLTVRSYAQQVITVTDVTGQNTRAYDILDSAIAHCNDGDNVYIPGGAYNVSKLTINKSVNIFGAGYRADSAKATGATIFIDNIRILSGASKGSLTGVYVSGDIIFGTDVTNQVIDGYTISRCNANAYQFSYTNSANNPLTKNINVTESVFRGAWNYVNYAKNVSFEKCIFTARTFYIDGMVSFNNCYFLHRDKGWSELNTVKGAIFSNNVFLQEKYFCYSEDVNEFHNNLFVEGMTETELPAQVLSNNIYNYPIDSIFVGGNSFNTYKENFDYHLRQEVLDIIQGSDGTAIGIYGTAYPFKDGALPYNPHISFKSIAPSTNAEGKIKVNIKVSAQDR